MADFYIVPPRLTVGTFDRANVVNSINSLKGDLTFIADANSGIRVVISGNTFRFAITENYYVKKQGDTYPKNLVFTPESGYYGLAVASGAGDPGIGSTGGIYFNTSSNTLRVYNGTSWGEITGSGITQGAADLRYLKLDGTNTPTANISMGSAFLRLANLTTQALPGTTGQMFFNTSTGRINVYNGTYWDDVGLGVTSIQIGFGLTSTQNPIVQSGTVSVDLTANYTWTGSHNFTSPVTFSAAGQSFNISKLFISGQSAGDLIYFNGTNWTKLGIGSVSQALVVDSSGTAVTWGAAISTSSGLGLSTLNGIGSTVQYFAVGTSGSLFNISSSGSTHTFNIPIAGTGATGLVSTGTQTFTGSKTFDTTLTVSAFTGSASTTTGALIVNGGIGIGGSINSSASYASSISGVVLSNGVIASGSWAGSLITGKYGGTGYSTYTKGDILVGAGGTFIKLGVGSDTYVLTASSTSATGLTWSPTAATAATGITTLNSLTATQQYFSTGTSGSTFNISSSGSTHTFNIPIAGTGATGLVSTLAQTFAGAKTFTGDVVITSSTASTYMANGALTVNGGVGISGQLSVNQVAMGYTGIATNPVMAFIGSTNASPITMSVLSDGSLLWEGSSGKLFGINNNLSSGWIFNVGDISGLPILRANADGTIAMAEFAANVGIGLSNPSYKLHVVGDTNLSSGYVYRINGTSVLSSTQVLGLTVNSGNITSGAWSGTAISVPYGGTGLTSYTVGDILYASGSATIGRLAAGTAGSVLISAGAGATPYYSSPALFVSGNATTAANINIVSATTGTFYPLFTNTSSTTSGVAVSVDSGISYDSATDTLTSGKFSGLHSGSAATFTNIYGTLTGFATTATNVNSVSSTGTNATHYLMFSPVNGGSGVALSSGVGITFNPSTGQLGLGTGSALINGLLLGTSSNTITTTSGNLILNAGGGTVLVAGNLNVQGTATYIDSTTETITDPVIVLGSGAGGTHSTVTDTQDRGIEYRRYSGSAITGFFGFSNASGRFTFIPNANISATNTYTGAIGVIEANITGSAITSTNFYGTFVGSATTSTSLNVVLAGTNASHPILFTPTSGTASGVAVSTESSFVYNPSTDILSVSGLAVTSTTASTNSSTGALIVTGGVGIGQSVIIGGRVGIGTAPNLSMLNIQTSSAGTTGLSISASTSQSAPLLEWSAASGGGRVRSSGEIHIGNGTGFNLSSGGTALLSMQGRGGTEGLAIRGFNSGSTEIVFETQGNPGNQLFAIFGDGGVNAPRINVTNSTGSTSTSSGALIVTGGVGIGQSVNISGRVGIGTNLLNAALNIQVPSTTTSGIILRGNGSQTSDAVTYYSSTGSTNFAVDANGRVRLTGMDGIWNTKVQQNIFDVSDGRVNWNLTTWQNSNIYWVTANAYFQQAAGQLQFTNSGTTSVTGIGVLATGWDTAGASRVFGIVSPSGSERTYFRGYGNLVINPNNPNALHTAWNTMDLITLDISGTATTYSGNIILGKVEGTERFSVGPFGNTKITVGSATTATGLIVKAVASQSGNIIETQASTGATNFYVSPTGGGSFSDNLEIRSAKEVRFNNSGNTFYTGFKAGANASNTTYTLPIAFPGSGTSVLQSDTSGTLSWVGVVGSAVTAQNLNIVAANTNSAHQLVFTPTSGSGSGVAVSSRSTLNFNPSTDILSVSGLAVTASTTSTSSSTGALIVTGGVGIGGSLYSSSSYANSISGVVLNNGVITSGSWAGSTITGLYGGTGYTNYTAGDILVGAGGTFIRLNAGSSNYVLTSNGSGTIPSWQAVPPSAASSVAVSPTTTNSSFSITTVNSASGSGLGLSTIASFVINPSTGILSVSGLAVTASTTSTSSSTGALIVTGGVGIGASLYTSSSYANSISGVVLNNGVITSGSWAGSTITARYGGTGYTTYTTGDILVGAGSTFIKVGSGSTNYVLSSNSMYPAGVGWTWVSAVGVGTNPPSTTHDSDLWWNATDGSLNFYYNDGDTSQWVEIAGGSGIDLSQQVHITSTIGSTNVYTGALVVDGGVGIAGTLHTAALVINGTYDVISQDITLSGTGASQVIHTLDSNIYRSAKYMVQISHAPDYEIQELLTIHDGTNTYLTQYAQLLTGNNLILATYDVDLSGGNMRLLATPAFSNTTFKLYATAMRK